MQLTPIRSAECCLVAGLCRAVCVSATIGLTAMSTQAEVAPERGSVSLRYLDYVDYQPDLERMRIRAPSLMVAAPVAGVWLLEGSWVADTVSGASPAYHTVSRSASRVHDKREAADAKVTRYFPRGTLKLGAAYSTESDYLSRAMSLQGSVSSESQNTTLNFGFGMTRDRVMPINRRVDNEPKAVIDLMLGVTQILTPVDIAQVTASFTRGRGYFSDPYKFLDQRPRERDQTVILARWNHHFPALEATTRLSYRNYADTWAVRANTLTMEYVQSLPSGWMVTPLARAHTQNAAAFYRDVNPAAPTRPSIPAGYESGVSLLSYDQRLSAFGALTVGVRVAKQINADWQWDVKVEHYQQRASWYWGGRGSPGLAPLSARMVQLGVSRQF